MEKVEGIVINCDGDIIECRLYNVGGQTVEVELSRALFTDSEIYYGMPIILSRHTDPTNGIRRLVVEKGTVDSSCNQELISEIDQLIKGLE